MSAPLAVPTPEQRVQTTSPSNEFAPGHGQASGPSGSAPSQTYTGDSDGGPSASPSNIFNPPDNSNTDAIPRQPSLPPQPSPVAGPSRPNSYQQLFASLPPQVAANLASLNNGAAQTPGQPTNEASIHARIALAQQMAQRQLAEQAQGQGQGGANGSGSGAVAAGKGYLNGERPGIATDLGGIMTNMPVRKEEMLRQVSSRYPRADDSYMVCRMHRRTGLDRPFRPPTLPYPSPLPPPLTRLPDRTV